MAMMQQKTAPDSRKYCILRLDKGGNEAEFKIASHFNFKELHHLKIKLKKGGDEEIKRYLATKL